MAVLKKITLLFLLCLFLLPLRAQEFQPTPAQRGVRTSGDVAVGMLAALFPALFVGGNHFRCDLCLEVSGQERTSRSQ